MRTNMQQILLGQGSQKRKDHLGKYQTSGMYPKVVVRACNKNFTQHLLSYPPATNGAKRNLGRLRYSCQRAPEQSINTSWIHGILKLLSIPLVSLAVTIGITGSGLRGSDLK